MNILDVVEKVYNTVNCADHDEWMEELNITIKQRPLECAMTLLEFAGWQPMETAPRDGETVLVCYKYHDGAEESVETLSARYSKRREQWIAASYRGLATDFVVGWLPLPKAEVKEVEE